MIQVLSSFNGGKEEAMPRIHARGLLCQILGTLVYAELQIDVPTLKQLASDGNATAQFELATLFDGGLHGVERNEPKALLYDYFAAIGGSQGALMSMGNRHHPPVAYAAAPGGGGQGVAGYGPGPHGYAPATTTTFASPSAPGDVTVRVGEVKVLTGEGQNMCDACGTLNEQFVTYCLRCGHPLGKAGMF